MAGSKIQRSSLVIHLKAGHAKLNLQSAIPDFKSDLSRVARFTTAGQRNEDSVYEDAVNPIMTIFVHPPK